MSAAYMPLYVGDYRRDTSHLSTVEHGAYLLLLMHYYGAGSLPAEDERLARIALLSAVEWLQVRPTIQAFFFDGWRHKRVESEIEKHAIRVANGQQGGRPKKLNESQPKAKRKLNESPKPSQVEEGSELRSAPDARTRLFSTGAQLLADQTGRTPDSCKSLIGRWLKLTDDEAVHVLAAIEDAHRNRVADPTAWITATLQARRQNHAGPRQSSRQPSGITTAIDTLINRLGGEAEAEAGGVPRQADPRLLSDGRR